MIDTSLDLTTLADGYDSGALSVTAVMETVLARIEAAGDDHVWIARCCAVEVLGRAARLVAMLREEAAYVGQNLFWTGRLLDSTITHHSIPRDASQRPLRCNHRSRGPKSKNPSLISS